ncbi:peptide chain release factor N(5)-glutamine methyltransferase [Helicobacter sp. MIT 11-5569]|nr:peptide chain release factor N(5)-glutamine methyltransferase [Helicobacter sp. MIT 11-5569]
MESHNTIKELLDEAVCALGESGIERARLEAEILLGFVLDYNRVELHCRYDENVHPFYAESFWRLIKRRRLHEPIEYLVEKVSFYGEEFYISHGALIPRPETEILIDKALEIITQKGCKNIVEIGVGSGAISIMLSFLKKDSTLCLHASDISPEALFNAYVNKIKFNAKNLELHHSSYLDFNTKLRLKFDVLIANPPYIKNGEKLPKSLGFEPKKALYAGEVGDEMLLHIIDLAFLHKIPYALCEMGYNQRESIKAHLEKIPHKSLEFYKDLAGLDRGFVISF